VTRSVVARLLAAAVLMALAAGAAVWLPVREMAVGFLDWTRALGPGGAVLIGLAYVPAAVLLVPGALLTLGAGFAYGVGVGLVAVSAGSTLAACVAFLLGRTLLREAVEAKLANHPRFRALDRAVAREGFKIVLLTRLTPVLPYTFLNYTYGLTSVSLRDYALASWIGMLPGTLMYIYVGSALKSLAELATGSRTRGPAEWTLFALGLVATVAVSVLVTRLARRALSDAEI
jgi:uncharacterized membrane protein YdjX (TVP38/TMEM64 family)